MNRLMGPFNTRGRRGAWIAGLTIAFGLLSGAAIAQQGDAEAGKRIWRETTNCKDCHGWSGDGVPEIPQMEGANLRLSGLDAEMAREIIRCGIPGTLMPSFRRNTWSQIIPCYGMTEPMEADMQPSPSQGPLPDRSIDALLAFLFKEVINVGPVTFEYCESYFGAGSLRCNDYPKQAAVENKGTR